MEQPSKGSSVALRGLGIAVIVAAAAVTVLSPPWRSEVKSTLVMRVDISPYADTESSQPQARPLAHPRVTMDPPPRMAPPEPTPPRRHHPVAARPGRHRHRPVEPKAARPEPAEPEPAEPEPAEPKAKAPPKPRVPAVGLVPEQRKPAIGIVDEKKGD